MSKDMVEQINDLIKLDYDAAEIYDLVIENIETPELHRTLGSFCRRSDRRVRCKRAAEGASVIDHMH